MEEFNLFWDLFNPDETFCNRRTATWTEWQKRSEQTRKAIIEWLQHNRPPQGKNPYFFVQDFREPRRQTLSYAEYYRTFGTTDEVSGWKKVFLPEQQKTIYVKS